LIYQQQNTAEIYRQKLPLLTISLLLSRQNRDIRYTKPYELKKLVWKNMDGLIQLLRTIGPGRVLTIVAGLVGALIFFLHILSGTSTGDMGSLYAGLDPAEGGRIVAQLETMGVPYRVEDNGTQILAPKNEIGRLRMVLAEAGLPSGGLIGYEIFDRNDSLGATSFSQDMSHLRALEGELARSIRTLAHVAAARVHLVLPRRELFSRQSQTPTASVVLRMNGPVRLNGQQVEAVRHLVAAAVPGLDPRRVAIVDNKGMLLAKGNEHDEKVSPTTSEEMRLAYEDRLSRAIETLLEKSVGVGRVRAQVTADMDFDHVTENAELYDPDGQVVRSVQNAQEGSSSSENLTQQAVTVENNLPRSGNDNGNGARSQSNRAEETINYEISKTLKTHIKEMGNVKKLSVAIVIDGAYSVDEKTQEKKYTPRTPEEITNYQKLVQSAIGFSKDRGDSIEIVNLPFVEDTVVEDHDRFFGFDRAQLIRLLEFILMVVTGLIIVIVVVRPLILQLIEMGKQRLAMAQEAARQQALAAAAAKNSGSINDGTDETIKSEIEKKFNLGRIDGLVRSSSLTKISDIIEKFPNQTVTMIRMWLAEGPEGNTPKEF
jgi:flagellar M-ring protein FliF